MQELREAVQTAKDFVEAVIDTADKPLLEEVERDGDAWVVTLSFAPPYSEKNPSGLSNLNALKAFNAFENRAYKRLRVVDGAVVSMKIRELAGG